MHGVLVKCGYLDNRVLIQSKEYFREGLQHISKKYLSDVSKSSIMNLKGFKLWLMVTVNTGFNILLSDYDDAKNRVYAIFLFLFYQGVTFHKV
jgi:hypothetical protein